MFTANNLSQASYSPARDARKYFSSVGIKREQEFLFAAKHCRFPGAQKSSLHLPTDSFSPALSAFLWSTRPACYPGFVSGNRCQQSRNSFWGRMRNQPRAGCAEKCMHARTEARRILGIRSPCTLVNRDPIVLNSSILPRPFWQRRAPVEQSRSRSREQRTSIGSTNGKKKWEFGWLTGSQAPELKDNGRNWAILNPTGNISTGKKEFEMHNYLTLEAMGKL